MQAQQKVALDGVTQLNERQPIERRFGFIAESEVTKRKTCPNPRSFLGINDRVFNSDN
jgi:hypothetical protein